MKMWQSRFHPLTVMRVVLNLIYVPIDELNLCKTSVLVVCCIFDKRGVSSASFETNCPQKRTTGFCYLKKERVDRSSKNRFFLFFLGGVDILSHIGLSQKQYINML